MVGNNQIKVSVIIPVYNNPEGLESCIEGVLDQNYEDEVEIIVIDNNSTDSTPEVAKEHPVKLIFENEIQSSYAARNRGIAHATGEILAFIDSDCIPGSHWLEAGVNKINSSQAELVAGRIQFVPEQISERSAAELYDSIFHLQTRENVKKRDSAPTANLFVKSRVFEKIGKFEENYVSGGDIEWTSKASKAGHSIEYSESAVVKHPTRKLRELLKKKFRVGRGGAQKNRPPTLLGLVYGFIPLNQRYRYNKILDRLEANNISVGAIMMAKLLLIDSLCQLSSNLGRGYEKYTR